MNSNPNHSKSRDGKFVISNESRQEDFKKKITKFTNDQFKIEEWSTDQAWHFDDEECYSDWFKEEIRQLKQIIIQFVKEGYQRDYCDKYEYSFLRKLVYNLSESENIIDALRIVNGWNGKIGLEIAVSEIRKYYKKKQKIPVSRGKGMNGISFVIRNGNWASFEVKSWEDLLNYSFGATELQIIRDSEEREVFDQAKLELMNFFETHQYLPTSHEKEFSWIMNSINSEKWNKFGIEKWNDLLILVFGSTNAEIEKYSGETGLELASEELKKFQQQYGRLPRASDFSTIAHKASNQEWKQFGIKKWNDLMYYVFRAVNTEIHFDFSTDDTLIKIQQELRDFKEKNGRLPTTRDMKMSQIAHASRDSMRKLGISSWNDLLKKTFGEINLELNKYSGQAGLELAIHELEVFKSEFGRVPTSKDKASICNAIYKGEWKEFGISSWNELLIQVFKKVNKEKGKYQRKERMDQTIKELKKFEKKKGILPCSNAKEFKQICNCIRRGDWVEYGIDTWNDLIKYVFGTVNVERNMYQGKIGLEKAMKYLKGIHEQEGKIPTSRTKGVRAIQQVISRNEWKEFGILCWNDLLNKVFGSVNKEKDKYVGKKGLEKAIRELKDYQETHQKRPTANNFQVMHIFAHHGGWKEVGIPSWNDLLINVFGNINSARNKYSGKEGFDCAVQKIMDYEKINGMKPHSCSKGMGGIYKNIRKGHWKKYGINCWKDLLGLVFTI